MLRRLSGLAILGLMMSVAACEESGTDPRFGSVTILLTDAPGDEVVEAWVTITDIYLQGQGGEGDPPGGRVFIMQGGEETHELLSLANTTTELVGSVQLPTGTFGQLRVVIPEGCIRLADGRVYSSSEEFDLCGDRTGRLQMPSFAQSGVKVQIQGLEITGGQQTFLLDFDVSQSFGHQAGQSGMWVMQPLIHGAQVQDAVAVAVTLDAGEVELPDGYDLSDFSVTLTPEEGDVSELAFEEVDGVFTATFQFLLPENGPFEVELNAPTGLTVVVDPDSPETVSPGTGETATVDWVLVSAEEAD